MRRSKYEFPFQRKLKGKTDYKKRLRLLFSRKPRLVVRKSLKHTKAQIVKYNATGDRTLVSTSSQDLEKIGWKNSTSNVPAAYLVGLLIGTQALKKGIKSAILDTGLQRNVKGSRIYAVLKGTVDAGLMVLNSPDIFPSEERTNGKHILNYAEKLKKEDIKKYKKQFSQTNPEKIQESVEKLKSKILKS